MYLKNDCRERENGKLSKLINILDNLVSIMAKYKYQLFFLYLYKIVVDLVYYFGISRMPFSSFGVSISVWNSIVSYIFLGLYSVYLQWNLNTEKVSSLLLRVIAIIYFIPITTWCGIGLGSTEFLFTSLFYWSLLSILDFYIPVICVKSNKKANASKAGFYLLFILLSILTIYISVKYTGFRIMLSIEGEYVYEVRAEAAEYNLPSLLLYCHYFATIIIPVLILISINMRKYIWVVWGSFLMLLTYSYDGSKSIFFFGILVVCGAFLWNEKLKPLLLPGCVSLGLLCVIEQKVLGGTYIFHLFFRRMGIELARLSDLHMRYFADNPRDIFRSTFLGKFGFESPYTRDIPYVIGNNFDTQIVNDNNGLLADVWMHLGGVGLLVMPIIIIITFRLFDAVSVCVKEKYLVGIIVYYAQIFTNSTWSTCLLTHGFLIMCLSIWLFPRNLESSKEIKNEDKRVFIIGY